jgi:hypothetical protein
MGMAMDYLQTTNPMGGLLAHTVYHGSPHKFNKFDMSKIGTGEGAQAYGHGLYFAESPEVAKSYMNSVRGDVPPKLNNFDLATTRNKGLGGSFNYYKTEGGFYKGNTPISEKEYLSAYKNALDNFNKTESQLYKVDIPDEAIPRMLDYDKPLSQQSPEVQESLINAMKKHGLPVDDAGYPLWAQSNPTGEAIHAALSTKGTLNNAQGQEYGTGLLKEAGIPGIKYLDQMSRGKGAGTSNFVLFSDDLPRILEINGQPTGLLSYADEAKKAQESKGLLDYQIEHKPMSVAGGAATLDDLTKSFGEDVYGKNAMQYYGTGDALERKTLRLMQQLRGKPDELVTIYRGVPDGVEAINKGDWVTLDKKVAEMYADPNAYAEGSKGAGKVIEMKVPAKHITSWPDSLLEFGYFPE